MFSTTFGLEQAALEGRKTQTRRVVKSLNDAYNIDSIEVGIDGHGKIYFMPYIEGKPTQDIYPLYQLEDVAVAQSYDDTYTKFMCYDHLKLSYPKIWESIRKIYGSAEVPVAWHNKLFVKAELMLYRIRINNIRIERLQDISEEDCLKEGIDRCEKEWGYWEHVNGGLNFYAFNTIKEAFAALINKVSGKGTWESNPWVFVYDFELVR